MPVLLSQITKTRHATPPRILLHGQEKTGKALALTTRVPTPEGMTTMGDIKVNDYLFAGDGALCRVVGVTDVMLNRPCYKVTLRGGQTIVADENHLWKTRLLNNTTGDASCRTTLDICNTLEIKKNSGSTKNHLIPWHNGALTEDVDLPLDPYLLGFWLGDGNKDSAHLSVATRDADILDRLKAKGIEFKIKGYNENESCMRVSITGATSYGRVKNILRKLDVVDNKHIPEVYLYAGYEQRLELLRGLMDSDGWVDKPPKSLHNYLTTDIALAYSFKQLLSSVGILSKMKKGRATLYGKDCGPSYTFSFLPREKKIVTTAFKLSRAEGKKGKTRPHHLHIENVVKIDSVPVRCIQVSSPDGMFLVTESYVPTHNSTFMSQAPRPIFIRTEDGLNGIDTSAFPLAESYDDVISALAELARTQHDFATVILDSADWLERLIHEKVCKDSAVKSIELAGGGYGKGYGLALNYWREVLRALDYLNKHKNMGVGVICHSIVVPFNDPEHEPYDRYEMKLHQPKKTTGAKDLLLEWADIIGFASSKIYVSKKKDSNVMRGIVSGESNKLNLVGSPAFVAGNRYSLPAQMNLNWEEFQKALLAHRASA